MIFMTLAVKHHVPQNIAVEWDGAVQGSNYHYLPSN